VEKTWNSVRLYPVVADGGIRRGGNRRIGRLRRRPGLRADAIRRTGFDRGDIRGRAHSGGSGFQKVSTSYLAHGPTTAETRRYRCGAWSVGVVLLPPDLVHAIVVAAGIGDAGLVQLGVEEQAAKRVLSAG
jgi:hypothetical protein